MAQNIGHLPPIVDLILQESKLSRLEQVLNAYENPNSQHIFVAAHRGGKELDVEESIAGNSIANIDNAVSKGFDLYESDIEILGDGTLVVFHDNDFNNLTNCSDVAEEICKESDTLEDKDSGILDELFLTYDNAAGVSDQRIPTLEAFLTAAKDKIMVKFDLKGGTTDDATLRRIFDTVEVTGTAEQVLIRDVDNDSLALAKLEGNDTRMIMRRYNFSPSVAQINSLADTYDVRAISIPNGAPASVISAAHARGLIVEVHELQGVTNQQREDGWQAAIDDGVRQIHSFKPTLLFNYLQANGYREF